MDSLSQLYQQLSAEDAELLEKQAGEIKLAQEEESAGRIMARGFADEMRKLAIASETLPAPKAVPRTATGTERVSPVTTPFRRASGAYLKAVQPQRMISPPRPERPRYRPTPKFRPTASPPAAEPVKKVRVRRRKKKKAPPPIERERKPFESGTAFMKRKSKQWGREWTESPAGKEFREKYVAGRFKKNLTTKGGLTAKKGRGGYMYVEKGRHGESVPVPISEHSKIEKRREAQEAAEKKRIAEWRGPDEKMSVRDAEKFHAAKEKERQRRQRRRGRVGRAAGAARDFAKRFDFGGTAVPKYKEGWRSKLKREQLAKKDLLRAAGVDEGAAGTLTNDKIQAMIEGRAKAGLPTYGHSKAEKLKAPGPAGVMARSKHSIQQKKDLAYQKKNLTKLLAQAQANIKKHKAANNAELVGDWTKFEAELKRDLAAVKRGVMPKYDDD
jgi:hypothetical protein